LELCDTTVSRLTLVYKRRVRSLDHGGWGCGVDDG
jgi:hypothetical protein